MHFPTRQASSVFAKLAFIGVLSLAASAGFPADDRFTFTLRETIAGSMIPVTVAKSPIPFDKSYEDLTPEQREILRADYEKLGPDDETPFPAAGLRLIAKKIASEALKYHVNGSFIASATIDSAGNATTVKIYKSPLKEVSAIATSALMTEKFRPARCAGAPCSQEFVLRLQLVDHS